MKTNKYFSNLVVLAALLVFGMFSFPVQRTADAKFEPAKLMEQPEMAVEYSVLDTTDAVSPLHGRDGIADINANTHLKISAP